ncbi:PKD domain-containing protein [Cytophagaceae bacterium DM2B3-1]|uniref:PKD domain-containing protein n=1 Tax=Xanthocytophaga flava TaxID=3048013 RepID=A0ABT7CV45_9BACT|nr:PKD domain-containing protein [Xanthocytophaga flavus]MDJ1497639.1 PKD domain-containing protein [Xanthocytophaga flavus]
MAQVSRIEYFVDSEPGYGKATSFSFNPEMEVSSGFVVDMATLTAGFHTLYIRTQDKNGHWSHLATHPFYLQPAAATTLVAGEYFIDADPGFGKGISLAVTADGSSDFVIPLTEVTTGFHTLYIRTRDNKGTWSHPQVQSFYVQQGSDQSTIVAMEYSFANSGFTSSVYKYILPVPASVVDLEFPLDMSQLPADKEYELSVRAISNNGLKSQPFTKRIKVCSNLPAKSKFDYIGMGTQVSFMDSSENVTHYLWDFGDGKTDTVSNPMHTYTSPGLYNVKLITSNLCNNDTLVKQISVLNVQSVAPNKGGNTGSVTVAIAGNGFTQETQVKLINNGNEITAVNMVTNEDGRMLYATFELYNQQIGKWDIVINNKNSVLRLKDAFIVEKGEKPIIKVEIEGRNVARIGRAQKYSFTLYNMGNIDAKGVLFWLALPKGTGIEPIDFSMAVSKDLILSSYSNPMKISVDSLFEKNVQAELTGFVIRNISAKGKFSLQFELTLTNSGAIYAWVSDPTYGSPLNPDVSSCIDAISGLTKIIFDVGSVFIPTVGCMKSLYENGVELYNFSNKVLSDETDEWKRISQNYQIRSFKGEVSTSEKIGSYSSVLLNKYVVPILPILAGTLWECLPASKISELAGFGKWSDDFLTVLGQNLASAKEPARLISKVAGKDRGELLWKIVKTGVQAADFEDVANSGENAYETGWNITECSEWARNKDFKEIVIELVNSIDPNEKIGSIGIDLSNHVQGNSPLPYTIYFENLSTATAPAQEVFVVDTLDKTKFDLSTFKLGSFGFGNDYSIGIPQGLSAYSKTVDLHPAKNLIVRIDAKLDTSSGVLTWRFLSLDPKTMEVTDDPLDGFLPPNKLSPEGEGFVSFSVMPKSSLSTGTQIHNKASIFFDTNKPIVTNTFLNTIDKVRPTSQIESLPSTSQDTTFTIKWGGSDSGAGVRSYDVYYSVNSKSFQLWKYDISGSEARFTGYPDSTYGFYSIAKDYVGNLETEKTRADASVTIDSKVTGREDPLKTGFWFYQNYPNPAKDQTTVEFKLSLAQKVTITVHDLQGKVIAVLTDKLYSAGTHHIAYDVNLMAPGLYICEFRSEKYQKAIKFIKR